MLTTFPPKNEAEFRNQVFFSRLPGNTKSLGLTQIAIRFFFPDERDRLIVPGMINKTFSCKQVIRMKEKPTTGCCIV